MERPRPKSQVDQILSLVCGGGGHGGTVQSCALRSTSSSPMALSRRKASPGHGGEQQQACIIAFIWLRRFSRVKFRPPLPRIVEQGPPTALSCAPSSQHLRFPVLHLLPHSRKAEPASLDGSSTRAMSDEGHGESSRADLGWCRFLSGIRALYFYSPLQSL